MKIGNLVRQVSNPAMGLFPILLFLVLQYFISYYTALWIGITAYTAMLIICVMERKSTPPFFLMFSGVIFITFLVITRFTPLRSMNVYYIPVIFEVIFLFLLWAFKLYIPSLKSLALKKDKEQKDKVWTLRLDETIFVTKMYQNVIAVHLLIGIVYKIFPKDYQSESLDNFIFYKLNLILILMAIVYEYIRLSLIRKKFSLEDWLPVVNETGTVTGRIAFSVSHASKESYLHPNVRVAFIYKGMLYLTDRPSHYILDPGKVDYPFEEYVRYKQSLDDAVKNVLIQKCGTANLPVKFVFRYLFKNNISFRLIYLFAINIHDENTMNELKFSSGKLWTEKQIEENMESGIFSECFEKEYEILKNTVLMTAHFINGLTGDNQSASNISNSETG